jgi:glycerol-3-phosphate acyltransferase PlsY
MFSPKSLVYGIICALIVLIVALVINHYYPIDSIITATVSLLGMILPPLIDKLTTVKLNGKNDLILNEITSINSRLAQLSNALNANEDKIIEIQSLLTFFHSQKIIEELVKMRIEIDIIKEQLKK